MRLDYILYAIGVILFIATLATVVYTQGTTQSVGSVSTFVVGLVFLGLGYTQRPKQTAVASATTSVPEPPPSIPQQQQPPEQEPQQVTTMVTAPPEPETTEALKPEEATPIVQELHAPEPQMQEPPVQQLQPETTGLTKIKGIGEKRAAQLKALGINTIDDLGKASPQDLATKLNISPKITSKWIENAKENGQRP